MFPPVFQTCAASTAVTDLLGTSPTRLFPFGKAPQDVVKPYVVWQTITGTPENYLDKVPDADSWTIQIDVYSDDQDGSGTQARLVAEVLRDAIEPVAYVTAWLGESRDAQTNDWRYSFQVDWIVLRIPK